MSAPNEAVTPFALGLDRGADWRMRWAPDMTAPSILVDFGEVRNLLGLAEDDPLHTFVDLDRTLRVTHGDTVEEDIAAHLRAQLAAGTITSVTITTNSFNPDASRFGAQIHDRIQTLGPMNMDGLMKPRRAYFDRVIDTLGIRGEPTLVIGDKGRRDVLGAHVSGLFSLLVTPLGTEDLWFDRWGLRKVDNMALRLGSQAVRKQRVSLVA
jgi:predicted HAD superfamily phosphohydrolase YqeG